jgi:hypothetical protein
MVVVLPAPLEPIKAVIEPLLTVKFKFFKIVFLQVLNVKFLTSMMFIMSYIFTFIYLMDKAAKGMERPAKKPKAANGK